MGSRPIECVHGFKNQTRLANSIGSIVYQPVVWSSYDKKTRKYKNPTLIILGSAKAVGVLIIWVVLLVW